MSVMDRPAVESDASQRLIENATEGMLGPQPLHRIPAAGHHGRIPRTRAPGGPASGHGPRAGSRIAARADRGSFGQLQACGSPGRQTIRRCGLAGQSALPNLSSDLSRLGEFSNAIRGSIGARPAHQAARSIRSIAADGCPRAHEYALRQSCCATQHTCQRRRQPGGRLEKHARGHGDERSDAVPGRQERVQAGRKSGAFKRRRGADDPRARADPIFPPRPMRFTRGRT